MRTSIIMSISTTILLSLSGCSVEVHPPGMDSEKLPPSSAEKTTGHAEEPVPTVTLSGKTLARDASVAAGVEVCARESPPTIVYGMTCTTSGADGAWSIADVPGNQMITVSFEKAGFLPVLRAIQTADTDLVIPSEHSALLALDDAVSVMGAGLDVKRGQIAFFAAGADDVTVTATSLDGTSGKAIFLDQDGNVAPDATQGGSGFVENVPAGYYLLTFHSATATCTADTLAGFPAWAQPAAGEAQVLAPVEDGYVTTPIGVRCTPANGTTSL